MSSEKAEWAGQEHSHLRHSGCIYMCLNLHVDDGVVFFHGMSSLAAMVYASVEALISMEACRGWVLCDDEAQEGI